MARVLGLWKVNCAMILRPKALAVTAFDHHEDVVFEEEFDRGEEGGSFAFFHFHEAAKLIQLVQEKKLANRDITILLAIMSKINVRTGRAKFMVKNLAAEFNTSASSISASISRLKKEFVVASFVEYSGDKYYMVNPYLLSVGSKQRWGLAVRTFFSAFE